MKMGVTPGPGLWLVHDAGIYLMSNGMNPHLPNPNRPESSLVIYAKGYGPDVHVPGDDYVEFLELAIFEGAIKDGCDLIVISLTGTHMDVKTYLPPGVKRSPR
jgi:hypothetical protein